MSSPIRNCGEAHRINGDALNDFLYADKNGTRKERTYEELWEMLEDIRVSSWDSYYDIKNELGW